MVSVPSTLVVSRGRNYTTPNPLPAHEWQGHRSIFFWRRFRLLVLLAWCFISTSDAWTPPFMRERRQSSRRKAPPIRVMPLTDDDKTAGSSSKDKTSKDNQQAPLLDWYASGSIGSLLMQMQKKEEEMRKFNKTLLDKEHSLDLDMHNSTPPGEVSSSQPPSSDKKIIDETERPKKDKASQKLTKMDISTAKELDDAVSIRLTSSLGKEVKILDLPELYQVLTEETSANSTAAVAAKDLPPLSKPEHYRDRIGRDMRHLAVSIAACVDDVAEWRLVYQQVRGGVLPLIDCIREGAESIRERRTEEPMSEYVSSRYEESFLAASASCRALRDICGINLDLAAVITDGLLRANAAEPLIADLVTILKYAEENSEIPSKVKGRRRLNALRRRRLRAKRKMNLRKNRKETRLQCKLYVLQLLLAMVSASDSAVDAFRNTDGLLEAVLKSSSYARKEQTRRWLRYPGEMVKSFLRSHKDESSSAPRRRPFIEAASLTNDLNGRVQGAANQILAAMGYNKWVPKIPGQRGIRILSLDGGGSRGMTSVMVLNEMVKSLGGVEVSDCFDFVVGTSTGAIISFLSGLKRENSEQVVKRYDVLIPNIFMKSNLQVPLLLFTTASYSESPFMNILSDILGDETMLDSRADPAVPYVFAVTSKMSSTPTHVALFRNYNYNRGEIPDPFLVKPEEARGSLGLSLDMEDDAIRKFDYPRKASKEIGSPGIRPEDGSRHPGSFRVLQRYALRASTAAPTVFKPVMMGGEMYCDGGIVSSNPTAIGIHEARSLFPDIPIELVVSIGTGGFLEQKSAPRVGWDGIIGQIVNSACDGEQIHHILEDVLGEGGTAQLGRSSVSNTCYMRFNPILGMPDDFPIDVTDPDKLEKIKQISRDYMSEPEQKKKLEKVADVLQGRRGWRKWLQKN